MSRRPPLEARPYAVLTLVLTLIAALTALAACSQDAGKPVAALPPPAAPTKFVALTFDDGPDPAYTPKILDILDEYGAKATFFAVGKEVERAPELTRRVHDRGHDVQNHTWSHPDLRKLSWASFQQQVEATDGLILEQTDTTPRCLRPPYGGINSIVKKRATALGKKLVLWTLDSRDWSRPGEAAIVQRVLTGVQDGSVLLFHDGGGDRSQTVAALPTILKTLKEKGYGFRPACP
ncbi:polysaccharide deacetylase family protein [Kribbella sp. CA-294648]|uniref:polysaccharide deacetylase family protein n=1 Tax=Kribbella sp. CA-294648 TaxID=3239948 RepID=UPI003D910C6D